ncbi:MAG: hypothetical protein JWO62_2917 [Acidimicrobiaceae bacterium]|jgi:hypothetical protein|nr:hypothetical protein [Acidimicrobiaceae bacterium]
MAPQDFLEELTKHRLAAKPAKAGVERSRAPEAPMVRPASATSAASVLRLQRSVGNAGTAAFLQREERESAVAPDASSPVHGTIAGSGSPLDAATRSSMEQKLGADFSNVRLHVDAKSAESVQAAAYTVGENVVVHPNHYAAGTPQAQRTLAHELTHVKQQRSGPVDGTPREGGVQVSDPSDRFEREAERAADAAMSSTPAGASSASSGFARSEDEQVQALTLQRVSEEEEREGESEA